MHSADRFGLDTGPFPRQRLAALAQPAKQLDAS